MNEKKPDTTAPPESAVQQKLFDRIEKIGDLPIFSASVNRIRMMSASEETEATELAREISKDANLTAKLLRVSNSPYYARSQTKVGVASRAVIMLGFDTVRNITLAMKVIDSFQFKHPKIDVNSLLVKSYLAAGFVREIATKADSTDIEETYTCGLLHNMGDIIVAVTLPDEFLKMQNLVDQKKCSWEQAQRAILGTDIMSLAREVLKRWQFPTSVIQTVSDFSKSGKSVVRNAQQLNTALASFGSKIMDSLYTPNMADGTDFEKLLKGLEDVTGLRNDQLNQCLNTSFKMSCDLAAEYGLNKKFLRPKIVGSEDDPRNQMARALAYMAGGDANMAEVVGDDLEVTAETADDDADSTSPAPRAAAKSGAKSVRGDSGELVNVLHEITQMITQNTDINAIFSKILDGIQNGVGYDHAVLCLLTPDRKRYKSRFAVGPKAEALKKIFNNDVNTKTDLFSRITMSGEEVLVKDAHDKIWADQLKPGLVEATGATTFVAAAIRVGEKSLGFFYADTSLTNSEITPELYRGFIQMVTQGRIALSVRR